MKPTIHLYTICWNEEKFLEYFFQYYDSFVDEYHFYDDESDDSTLEILAKHPKVQIHSFETINDSYILSAQKLHESHWKQSKGRADWVIVTAVDEFLYHPHLLDYLNKCCHEEVTVIPATGFQMLSEFYPRPNVPVISQIKSGAYFEKMNKLSIFNPNEVEKTNYAPGRHFADPVGNIKYPSADILLNLHYKYLSFNYTLNRHYELNKKLRNGDKRKRGVRQKRWGHKYRWGPDRLNEDWGLFESNSIPDVFNADQLATYLLTQPIQKWWRMENGNGQIQKSNTTR